MSLTQELRSEFSAKDRQRGEAYFRKGRVHLAPSEGGKLFATVVGSDEYLVMIDIASQTADVTCDCPRFLDTSRCKHIWATILALEAKSIEDADQASPKLNELIDYQRRAATQNLLESPSASLRDLAEPKEKLLFHIDLSQVSRDEPLAFQAYRRKRLKNGKMSVGRAIRVARYGAPDCEPEITLQQFPSRDHYSFQNDNWHIPDAFLASAITKLAELGQWAWSWQSLRAADPPRELRWDDSAPYQLQLHFDAVGEDQFAIRASLERPGDSAAVEDLVWAYSGGVLLFEDRLELVETIHVPWIRVFREQQEPMRLSAAECKTLLAQFAGLEKAPALLLDKTLSVKATTVTPRGALLLEWTKTPNRLDAQLQFIYDGARIEWNQQGDYVFAAESGQRMPRDQQAELRLVQQLLDFPLVDNGKQGGQNGAPLYLHAKNLLATVKSLNELGWEVRAEGQPVLSGGEFPEVIVSSGKDWFDVDFEFAFDADENAKVGLPSLLEAVRRNQNTVLLDNGSVGLLPEEWLKRYSGLLKMGEATETGVRFRRSQAFVLDALLAEMKLKRKDPEYSRLVQRLKRFEGVRPAKATPTFQGKLRPYQQQGLGWFKFLKDFGFGGCLADEMGLGKTVQVLALLEKRRLRRATANEDKRPTLVVAPKSLIFNWIDEAKRFTPKLKVLDYTGGERKLHRRRFDKQHVILTTYGTLVRDIEYLKDVEFDYLVLDEAQAIKNSSSQTAKACRLLRGLHRLAMTGTPVENRLDDLWSIMEFLNPGMLGTLPAFQSLMKGQCSAETLETLRKALSPFILRRTKKEVLEDLPPKTEQTLLVELPPAQRRLYDELRDHYQAKLSKRIEQHGLKKSKMHVLEALLRTRQAACDPRLLDKDCRTVGGKVKFLADQLQSVVDDGHKALVFSQFTSLLTLVREMLSKRRMAFEYLDGSSDRRGERVKRFQEDPDLPVFLISLKAGGHGLNLTAADYVFILDPWWNPAAEAQAIDRTHRIGQTKSVMAYRLIAKDTIEEKIVQLQNDKRRLADSIVTANGNIMRDLTNADLTQLFS